MTNRTFIVGQWQTVIDPCSRSRREHATGWNTKIAKMHVSDYVARPLAPSTINHVNLHRSLTIWKIWNNFFDLWSIFTCFWVIQPIEGGCHWLQNIHRAGNMIPQTNFTLPQKPINYAKLFFMLFLITTVNFTSYCCHIITSSWLIMYAMFEWTV